MIHILVVEDDIILNQTVCKHLSNNRYQVTGCLNPSDAYDCLCKEQFDMIISDIMMPEIDGYEFAESVRRQDENIPILFMTARDDFLSKQRGYHLGVDDYLTKPINLDELLLHIEALLRRARISAQKRLAIGNLVLDEREVIATVDGEPIAVTLREFQILFKLLSYPKHVFTRSQLLEEFNGVETESGLRTIDVHIKNLRIKFAHCDAFKILTVRGMGYKAVIE